MLRKLVFVSAVVLVVLAVTVAPVAAITGNYVEDFEHPFVGLVVFYDASGEFSHRCSGSLLSPSVFLTAGHCTAGVNTARVYFQQDAGANFNGTIDPVTGYPETCAAGTLGVTCATSDELYTFGEPFASFPNTQDVGLVILDQPISLAEYGQLAAAGSLDRLATRRGRQEVTFTASGYGVSRINPVQFQSFRERLMAEVKLVNLRNSLTDGFNIQTSANPGNGRGGTCFGDSGGPIFYGGFSSNTIVAVTSFGLNSNCRGVDFSYRTDQQAVIDWILAHAPADERNLIQIVQI
jgi:hypothetical protein